MPKLLLDNNRNMFHGLWDLNFRAVCTTVCPEKFGPRATFTLFPTCHIFLIDLTIIQKYMLMEGKHFDRFPLFCVKENRNKNC